ncbi:hypothetical protein GCK72_019173 [Caenorhabditis remanei]|uniref:NadR/Ttd14 AAA domain-containing protein n=2 Tax=Caenorhabditis remanei TaxID=31234 RepID=E3LKZ8_CAERE|nr:hypothetical protein GCK72_019173 [Caenorhabditis remanei]EFP00159.1 hypothetical protein CRE_18504 [Caenorhabditis remanei]KAF1752618.1 hypothetical protein GCK72_019173 [Caenorhabditis remanei]
MPPARTAGPAQPVQPMVASPPTGSMIPPTQSLSSATAASASSSRRPSPIYPQNHHRKYRTSPVKTTCSRSMSLERKVYKIVLTGGPCGGKTTAQVRLATFFENLGWKVFTVPETATILLGGRVKFSELDAQQSYIFQRDLLATMHQIENTFFNQASAIKDRNVLVICDRGCMDPSAYSSPEDWSQMLKDLHYEEFDLRCSRYDQIAHLVTAADGAEKYYTLANNATRSEGIGHAMELDKRTRSVWIGHPYMDIIDNKNTSNFDDKVNKLIQVVCDRTGIRSGDRLAKDSKKRKWLVEAVDWANFGKFEEFEIEHFYLLSDESNIQHRFRRRTQKGRSTFTLTSREYFKESGDSIETRMNVLTRDYNTYVNMKDKSRASIFKKRRCFMYGNMYFNMDIYSDPLPPQANGNHLIFLETYTTVPKGTPLPDGAMPPFLTIQKEITGESQYSMYSLSKYTKTANKNEFAGADKYKDD